MKLYYSPGACSLSPHIALREAGLAFEPVLASTKSHKLQDGTDYYGINPLGYVPLLELDDGTRLREGPAIVQYIADLAPTKNLAPATGTLSRYRLQEWLTFIGTEIHKSYSPAVQPGHARRSQGHLQDQAQVALRVARRPARRQGVPDGRALHRGRRLPVHRHQLGQADGRRHRRPSPTCRPGMHASPPGRPCRKHEGRRPVK